MNKTLKRILLFVGETALATFVWCLLDYFMSDTVNIAENLIDVAVLVLLGNIIDYIIKKYKNKKNK